MWRAIVSVVQRGGEMYGTLDRLRTDEGGCEMGFRRELVLSVLRIQRRKRHRPIDFFVLVQAKLRDRTRKR